MIKIYRLKKFANKWLLRTKIFWRLLLFKLKLNKKPVFGVLTVTSNCDFKCKYCFADYHKKIEKNLTTEQLLKTIDEMKEYGVIYLNVHGGEALLRKDISTVINHAKSRNMFVNLITNGTLLEKRWEEIKNIDSLCISIDGSPENNDKNRGNGTFKIASNAVDFALKKRMVVRIGMTITKHTKDDIEWLLNWAKKRKICIQPFLLFDQDNLPEELWMTPEENKLVLKKLIELKKNEFPIFYSSKTLNYALNWPYNRPVLRKKDMKDIKIDKNFKFIPCYYKLLNVLIESNGTVRTCNIMARSGIHINILDKKVKEAKEELLSVDDCLYCYHLPQMEFSQLMDLNLKPLINQFISQFKEDISKVLTRE